MTQNQSPRRFGALAATLLGLTLASCSTVAEKNHAFDAPPGAPPGASQAPPTLDGEIRMYGSAEEVEQFNRYFEQCKVQGQQSSQGRCPAGQVCKKASQITGQLGGGAESGRPFSERKMSERCRNLEIDVEQPCVARDQTRADAKRQSFYTLEELTHRCGEK